MGLPLGGVRIVDMGHTYAVSHGTKFLADLGAEVIKVESPTYLSPSRYVAPYPDNIPGDRFWERSGNWHELNRNKLDIAIDLATDRGKDLFRELVRCSDVVMENFSAGVLTRLGLDWEVLSKVRPGLIMLSSSGFGHSGPWQTYKSWGSTLEPMGGLSHLTGYTDGPPTRTTIAYTDVPAGLYAAFAVLAALQQRKAGGAGQWIDLAQYEIGVSLVGQALMEFSMNGRNMTRTGDRDPLNVPQGVYRCEGSDAWLAISVTTEDEWRGLCRALGQPRLADDPRFAFREQRAAHHYELDGIIGAWTERLEHRQAAQRLQDEGVPAGPVLNGKELLLDPHLKARGFFQRFAHDPGSGIGTRLYHGLPFTMSKTPFSIRTAGPKLGEHNEYVFGQLLGLSPEEIAGLYERRIIGTAPAERGKRDRSPSQTPLQTLKDKGLIEDYDADYKEILGLPETGARPRPYSSTIFGTFAPRRRGGGAA